MGGTEGRLGVADTCETTINPQTWCARAKKNAGVHTSIKHVDWSPSVGDRKPSRIASNRKLCKKMASAVFLGAGVGRRCLEGGT